MTKKIVGTGSIWRDFVLFILFHRGTISCPRCREDMSVIATKYPRIFSAFYNSLQACLDVFITLVPLSWHSAIQKILESSDEHEPDIGVSFYCMETVHLLLARSCRRSVICFHRFLLNKNLKPPVHSMGSCCFGRSFFDAENHSSTSCKLFEANVGLLSWLSYCIEIAETAVTMPAS